MVDGWMCLISTAVWSAEKSKAIAADSFVATASNPACNSAAVPSRQHNPRRAGTFRIPAVRRLSFGSECTSSDKIRHVDGQHHQRGCVCWVRGGGSGVGCVEQCNVIPLPPAFTAPVVNIPADGGFPSSASYSYASTNSTPNCTRLRLLYDVYVLILSWLVVPW